MRRRARSDDSSEPASLEMSRSSRSSTMPAAERAAATLAMTDRLSGRPDDGRLGQLASKGGGGATRRDDGPSRFVPVASQVLRASIGISVGHLGWRAGRERPDVRGPDRLPALGWVEPEAGDAEPESFGLAAGGRRLLCRPPGEAREVVCPLESVLHPASRRGMPLVARQTVCERARGGGG